MRRGVFVWGFMAGIHCGRSDVDPQCEGFPLAKGTCLVPCLIPRIQRAQDTGVNIRTSGYIAHAKGTCALHKPDIKDICIMNVLGIQGVQDRAHMCDT